MSRVGYITIFSVVVLVVIVLAILGYVYRDKLFTSVVAPEERALLEEEAQEELDRLSQGEDFCTSLGGVYLEDICFCEEETRKKFKLTLPSDGDKIDVCRESLGVGNPETIVEACNLSCGDAIEEKEEKTQINKDELLKTIIVKLDDDFCSMVGGEYSEATKTCKCGGDFIIGKVEGLTGEEEQAVLQECSSAFNENTLRGINACDIRCVPLAGVVAADTCFDTSQNKDVKISNFQCTGGSVARKNDKGDCVCDAGCVDPTTGERVGVSSYTSEKCKLGEFVKVEEGTNKCVCSSEETGSSKTTEGIGTPTTPEEKKIPSGTITTETPEVKTPGSEITKTETPKEEVTTKTEVTTETPVKETATVKEEPKKVAETGAEDYLYIISLIAFGLILLGSGFYVSSKKKI